MSARLAGRPRRMVRALHIVVSGAWLGLAVGMLTLGLAALAATDPALAAAAYTLMGGFSIAIPIVAIGSILTGVVLSVATPWGLLRHWWIVVKIVLAFSTIGTAIALGGAWRLDAIELLGTGAGTGLPGRLLVGTSVVHLLMLGAATVISVEKPWGRTTRAAAGDRPPTRDRLRAAASAS